MLKYFGLRVFPSPYWSYKKNFNYLGTVVDKEPQSDNVVYVIWDDGTSNNYEIGKNESYDLLLYDSAATGVEHSGFKCAGCRSSIYGVKWGCFQCRDFLCIKCYMNDCDLSHHYYRIDSPNEIGSFVGKRVSELRIDCCGIFEESKVKLSCQLYGIKKGKVDKFLDKDITFRSFVHIKMNETNMLKKKKLGYKGKVEVELDPDEPHNIKQKIYPNHLRILGRHPLFNCEISKLFNNDLLRFPFNFFKDLTDFQIDDIVYIDCFDNLSLLEYQNDFGESNDKVEMLIGTYGTVKSIKSKCVEVYFEKLDESFCFNEKILFNNKNTERKLIRISEKTKLTDVVSKWKALYVTAKISDFYWIPDDEIIDKISDKIGVVVTNELPGGLVGIQFKLFPHEICMLIPRNACIGIDKSSDSTSAMTSLIPLIENLDLSTSVDNENIEKGRILILDNKTEECIKWITDLESELTTKECVNIMILAVESENIEIINCLINKLASNGNNSILEIILSQYSRNVRISNEILEVLLRDIDNLTLPNNNDGENIIHLAAKKGYIDEIKLILKKKKELINSVNSKTGYSALHYAVENNNLSVIELLMENDCDIYIKDKMNSYTALHLALKHQYLESLICVLQFLTKSSDLSDLDTNIVDNNDDCILHLSANLNTEKCRNKWKSICDKDIPLIKDTIYKLKRLESTSKSPYLKSSHIIENPFAMISFLILLQGKYAFENWIGKLNSKSKTPENYFMESCKNLEPDNFNLKKSFNIFYRHFNAGNDQFCEFCFCNPVTVTYKPCGHKIHCENCSFMPYKCSKCGEDIVEKSSDSRGNKLITIESWEELAKFVKNDNCPQTLSDWHGFISKTIKYLECTICFTRNWNLVLECGHQQCNECFKKSKKCGQCSKENPNHFEIKGN